MRLILSSRHPRNSAYSTEDGRILYKVDKPHQLGQDIATIRKAVHTVNGVWHGDSTHLQPRGGSPVSVSDGEPDRLVSDADHHSTISRDEAFRNSDSEDEEHSRGGHNTTWPSMPSMPAMPSMAAPMLEGHFAFYAQVEFHRIESTRFQLEGRDVSVKDYFRKEGLSWFGRGRVFKASNGKEYCWELGFAHLDMITNDEAKARVVRFRGWRPFLGLVKDRPATLEINPSCESILDEIIMTFIYCQKLRKDRERRRNRAAAAGGRGGG